MPDRAAVVTARFLNLRAEPGTARAPLAVLERGTRLAIHQHRGAWYRVTSPAGGGWVHGDFVTLLEAAPTAGFLREDAGLRAAPLAPGAPLDPPPPRDALTRALVRAYNAWGGLIDAVAERLALAPGAPVAVVVVESAGRGFAADGRLLVRFEPHVLWRTWGRGQPRRFAAHFTFDPRRPWLGHRFRASEADGWQRVHRSQASEWAALAVARTLDDHAALLATSMGAPQIMGFNHHRIGYGSPAAMMAAFTADARAQVLALFDFVKGPGAASPLLEALRREALADFAALYNGPGRAAEYGARLEAALERFRELTG